jgi:hypothetical protein
MLSDWQQFGRNNKRKQDLIKKEEPLAPELEISFPDLVFDHRFLVFDSDRLKLRGKWDVYNRNPTYRSAPWTIDGIGKRR